MLYIPPVSSLQTPRCISGLNVCMELEPELAELGQIQWLVKTTRVAREPRDDCLGLGVGCEMH